jgi:protein-tyrosine-phosphatase
MDYADHLNKMTVKDLREIAKRAGVKIPGVALSRATKDLLVSGIDAMVAVDWNEAKDIDAAMASNEATHFEYAGVVWTGPSATLLRKHVEMLRRFNPSMRRDKRGKIVLTPKQRRRIHKNDRRNTKRLGLMENAA